MADTSPAIIGLLGISVGLGLVTFLIVTATSFVKVSVVLFLVRNALGIQQTPPNIVLYAIALALTLYVSSPVIAAVSDAVQSSGVSLEDARGWLAALRAAQVPLVEQLQSLTSEADRAFFIDATVRVWPEEMRARADEGDLTILLPAFMVSELSRAFQIGFLLYLPFVVIDLVVTTILMAMGMSMVTPNLISTPLKLFLFVAVEGWTRLVQGLVLSYASV